jgi:hypothetical protein
MLMPIQYRLGAPHLGCPARIGRCQAEVHSNRPVASNEDVERLVVESSARLSLPKLTEDEQADYLARSLRPMLNGASNPQFLKRTPADPNSYRCTSRLRACLANAPLWLGPAAGFAAAQCAFAESSVLTSGSGFRWSPGWELALPNASVINPLSTALRCAAEKEESRNSSVASAAGIPSARMRRPSCVKRTAYVRASRFVRRRLSQPKLTSRLTRSETLDRSIPVALTTSTWLGPLASAITWRIMN